MKKNILLNVFITVLIVLIAISAIWFGIDMKKAKENAKAMEDMKLVLYEGPKSLKDATEEDIVYDTENRRDISLMHCTDTQILVDGKECYVYDTNVNHNRKWVATYLPPLSRTPITYFDFEGRADIEIYVPNIDIEKVSISPWSCEIEPEIDRKNHKISFSITEPDTYTVSFNDSVERAIHIFANPIETTKPDFNDDNVIYIGPGEWDIESICLESGQTLYIDGGAVVHGVVNANFAQDVTVCGRGIIDGSKYKSWKGSTAYIPLKFDGCNNVDISGVIALNSNAWVCQGNKTDNLTIDNLKIVSARPNGDGITLQSCENVKVTNCFVRSWDDSLVVKNYNKNSKNISFSNIQIWTDLAQSMEVGYETNKGRTENASITDVTFENIRVLHNFHKPVISVHNADDAAVSNILFKNIVVEDAQMGAGDAEEMPYLIDLNIAMNSNWSSTKERGTISGITIDGVEVLSGKFNPSRIKGFDEEHSISDVTIKNLTILGEKIDTFEEGKFEIDEASTSNLHIE